MKNIPNLITCLNLFAGCLSCVMVLKFDNYIGAFIFIALASVFDFLDGMAARLLKAYSNIGAELDSLADVVSFGLAPGCILYSYLVLVMGVGSFLPFIAFLLPVFAALRLAKFNVDTRQTTSFLGLPVPASGLFWASFIPSMLYYYQPFRPEILLIGTLVLLIIFCLLMVSEIPMFSLKFKNLNWKGNEWSFSLILIAIGLFVVFFSVGLWLLSIGVIIIAYIILSLIKNMIK
jgi:CDP-diacylglycerol--serine O-phosphatidyltransferase